MTMFCSFQSRIFHPVSADLFLKFKRWNLFTHVTFVNDDTITTWIEDLYLVDKDKPKEVSTWTDSLDATLIAPITITSSMFSTIVVEQVDFDWRNYQNVCLPLYSSFTKRHCHLPSVTGNLEDNVNLNADLPFLYVIFMQVAEELFFKFRLCSRPKQSHF